MACPICRKSISARDEAIFDCFNCNSKNVVAKPSVKFQVLLTDASGSITATLFDEYAEEYILVDGKTLMKFAAEKDQNVIAVFPKLALENEYRIQLKPREYPSRGVEILSYSISGIKPAVTEDKANEAPLTQTGKYSSASSELLDFSDSSQQKTRPESCITSAEKTGWLTLCSGIFAGAVALTGIGVLVYLKRSNLRFSADLQR